MGHVATRDRFTSLEEFVSQGKIISGEKFLSRSLEDGRFKYIKRDFLYRRGEWRGDQIDSLISRRSTYASRTVVIGHSDIRTSKIDALILKKFGVSKLYAVNNQKLKNFSEPLPLGITNNCDDSPIHRILGDESHFLNANTVEFQDEYFLPTIFINFTSSNNTAERNRVLKIAKNISSLYTVVVQSPEFTNGGRINYLKNLRTFGLIPCPEGNGVDTHRFWETLYMGGTPVVTKNPMMEAFYDNLPVIQIDSWEELANITLIESKWWQTKARNYNFELLSADYWVNRISCK
jgi:hypothetical protein